MFFSCVRLRRLDFVDHIGFQNFRSLFPAEEVFGVMRAVFVSFTSKIYGLEAAASSESSDQLEGEKLSL